MKGKLDDGTPVDIAKPGAIEQDGKWWEFMEYRSPKQDEYYQRPGCILRQANYDYADAYWIASEIPRATPEQLRAIGMKERDGRPVKVKEGESYWSKLETPQTRSPDGIVCYRFVLEPDVQKKIHTSCEGCRRALFNRSRNWGDNKCDTCFSDMEYSKERKNYTPAQPPQPEEPRFSVEEVISWIDFMRDRDGHLFLSKINHKDDGIAAFTERRRG